MAGGPPAMPKLIRIRLMRLEMVRLSDLGQTIPQI
jgi:hypothetical protein